MWGEKKAEGRNREEEGSGREEEMKLKKKEERREVWREAAAEIWNSTEELGIELKAVVGGGETLLIPWGQHVWLRFPHCDS